MKTYHQFLNEGAAALALRALPQVSKSLPGIAAGIGAVGTMLQAKRQGQGGRSQPADYGQSQGSQQRSKSTVRPVGPKADYKARLKAQQQARRAEVEANREERARQGIEQILGSDAERRAAAQARANPESQRAAARRRTISQRMERGLQNVPPEHRVD